MQQITVLFATVSTLTIVHSVMLMGCAYLLGKRAAA
jgi:hypothetical protein